MFSESPNCSFYKTSHLVRILLTFLKSLYYFKLDTKCDYVGVENVKILFLNVYEVFRIT